jgi:hypothetical protein
MQKASFLAGIENHEIYLAFQYQFGRHRALQPRQNLSPLMRGRSGGGTSLIVKRADFA